VTSLFGAIGVLLYGMFAGDARPVGVRQERCVVGVAGELEGL
jgi:hypothetical protein